ncbi:MAG TPA: dihydrodipicolinate synthase family protein [Terracidiphilus sp.]|nr:dihydrodipicolinate synthase family protein [Terracidiphilus sp.]
MLIEGVFAAVTTPFYPDERLYLRKLEANIERYSRSLLAGMVVLGSTGEAPALSDAESREVLRTASQAAAPDKVLIAGVGRESVKSTLELAHAAAEFEYDAVLVRTPTYYASQMTPQAVLAHFLSVADQSPLPVLLYNIPRCVPYNIPVEIVAELARHPNIIGIKDSSGDMARLKALIELTRPAPRRTVTVTPIFEAVTARMLRAPAARREENAPAFVSLGELKTPGAAPGLAVGLSHEMPAAPIKTRTREVGFQVLTGSAAIVLDSLQSGASGAILGLAACVPQACYEVYFAWKERDQPLAAEKQRRLLDANRRVVGELGISGVKYACDFNGFYGGKARLPLIPLAAEQRHEIEQILREIRN